MKAENKTVVQRPAGAWNAPAAVAAASSVFDAARRARPPRARHVPPDPATITIKRVPMPALTRGQGATSPYDPLLERMQPGDCVELTLEQAKALQARAKKRGVKVARRPLPDGRCGVWRL